MCKIKKSSFFFENTNKVSMISLVKEIREYARKYKKLK